MFLGPLLRDLNSQRDSSIDRNEKPFKCNHCESTFTRKDVIKRHHSRYHSDIPQINVTVSPAQNTAVEMDTSTAEESGLPRHAENQPAQVTPPTDTDTYLEGYPEDTTILTFMAQPPLSPTDHLNPFLQSRSFPFISDYMLLGGESFSQGLDEENNAAINDTYPSPSSISTQLNSQNWRGSCEISIAKRIELEKELQAALAQVRHQKMLLS